MITMASTRPGSMASRILQHTRPTIQTLRPLPRQQFRYNHSGSTPETSLPKWILTVPVVGLFILGNAYHNIPKASFDSPPSSDQPDFVVEQPVKKKGASKEQFRDLISSQHLQVKKSWENPGVYAWGSNTGKVVAPDSDEAIIKSPRRIPFFDDVLLRDIKLDRYFGAAITEAGDLLQWGKGYSESDSQPAVTLKGKNLVTLTISRDRILALSKGGNVYSIAASKSEQEEGPKPSESTWIPFWTTKSKVSYRELKPGNLGYGEKIKAVKSGLDHALLLTSQGRVFSAASTLENFPTRGQLGLPGLTFATRPTGQHDMCHEIGTLKGFDVKDIAAGDYHSLCLDAEGRVFSWGDNTSGQLGFDYSSEAPYIDTPSLLPITRLYQGTSQTSRATSIAAGGTVSFVTVDAQRVLGQDEEIADVRTLGRITADTWTFGQGIKGALGNGRWTHIQGTPAKIPALSGLYEWDESKNKAIPIRVANISVGQSHVAAVLANVTYVGATAKSSEHDVNWGADALWWGGNEFYQLGTGKRNNVNSPVYIAPLDMDAEKSVGRDQKHRFQITPRHKVKVKGRSVQMEQRIECGRNVTAVYSAV